MSKMLIVLIAETLVVTVVGSLLHFTYAWSKENKFVAIFAAVNESTWEHIKLALSGIFLCTLGDIWFLGGNPNYWLARSVSFVVPVVVIPLLFYGYRKFVLAAYLLLTKFPLHHNFLFRDPITGRYGYEKSGRKPGQKRKSRH